MRAAALILLTAIATTEAPSIAGEVVLTLLPAVGTNDCEDAGDINHDGVPDIVIGGNGKAVVYSGMSGEELLVLTASGIQVLGLAVSCAGDMDNDGFVDLLVSGNHAVVGFTATGGEIFRVVAPNSQVQYGRSIDAAGDVNDDGHSDVLVGDSGNWLTGDQGSLHLLSGIAGSLLLKIDATLAEGQLGYAVKCRDMNGDGVAELVSTSPGMISASGQVSGGVLVYSASTGANLLRSEGVVGAGFGGQLDVFDDVDGDGVPDFLVAAAGDDTAGPDFGAVYIVSGATGAIVHGVFGEVASAGFPGSHMVVTDDLDGDGRQDFLVSSNSDDTLVQDGGMVSGYSVVDGSRLFTIRGNEIGMSLGGLLGSISDLNGDGLGEWVVSANLVRPGSPQMLAAYAFSGKGVYAVPFGPGCAGSGGFTPTLSAPDHLYTADEAINLTIDGGVGGSPGLLFLGLFQTQIPVGAGCFFNVWPLYPPQIPFVLDGVGAGNGIAVLPGTIPPALFPFPVSMQAFVADPGAPLGYVGTNGLELRTP